MARWTAIVATLVWLALLVVPCVGTAVAADVASEAADALEAGDADTAAVTYERLLVESGPHPDVYYNLGVAHATAGNLPDAVLAFERSLALDPGRGDADAELGRARTALHETLLSASTDRGVTRGEPRALALWRLFRSLGTDLPAWVFLATWTLAFGGLIGRRWVSRQALRDALLVAVLLSGAGSLTAGGYLVGQWLTNDVRPGVVMTGAAGLWESPTELADQTGADDLYRGATVLVLDDRGDWLKVELMDGTEGWLPRATVAEVRIDRWPAADRDSTP